MPSRVIHITGIYNNNVIAFPLLCSFRQTCSQIAKKQFEDKWTSRRAEFIPVEWRTWLSLDKGTEVN